MARGILLVLVPLLLNLQLTSIAHAQTESISNGGFESGYSGWTQVGNFYVGVGFPNPHSGSSYAYFGVGSDGVTPLHNASGSLYQSVSISSNATSADLSFWLYITSDEGTSGQFDKLFVEIRNSSGSLLTTLATYSNLDKGTWYTQKSFSVIQYKGQTIRVQFRGTTDPSIKTVFRIDDISLVVQASTCTTPATPSLTDPGTSAPSGATYSVTWNSVANATRYLIQESTSSTFSSSTGSYVTGTSAQFSHSVASPTTYYYRVIADNQPCGLNSGFSNTVDMVVTASNAAPSVTNLNQYRADTGAAIPFGGTVPQGVGVIFKGTVNDPDGDTVRLEVELRQLPATFTGVPTAETISGYVSSGTVASTPARFGLVLGNYGWRARAADSRGATSNWVPENNPDFIVSSSPTLADLIVENVAVNPSSVTAGGSVTVSFSIRNQGGTAAGLFGNDIRLSSPGGGNLLLGNRNVSSLAAGATTGTLTQPVTIPAGTAAGSHSILVVADTTTTVTESNDANNTSGAGLTVNAPPADARITASLRLLQAAPYAVGQTVTAVFAIKNFGGTAITFDILTAGGRLNGTCPSNVCPDFTWARSVVLNPGATYNYQGTLTLAQAGSYHFFTYYKLPNGTDTTSIPTEPGITNTLDISVALPEYGTTIITHGFIVGVIGGGFPGWVEEMGVAVLERARMGRLWRFDAESDELEELTIKHVLLGADFVANDSGEQVILVDWHIKSNNATPGFAEGTGHALYSLLMGGAACPNCVGGYRNGFLGSIDENGRPQRPLHFIAHSFGAVVNSEAIQRLGALHSPPIQVEQMTTLDPHDWDEAFVAVDGGALTPDVRVWGNVLKADNYYNMGGFGIQLPHGRPIAGTQARLIEGDYTGFNLTGYLDFNKVVFCCEPHTLVHTFYHGTIEPDRIGREDRKVDGELIRPSWYERDELTRGYAYSRIGGRSNPSHFSTECRVDPVSPIVPSGCASPRHNDTGLDVDVDEPPKAIFDGGFSKDVGELDARPGFRNKPEVVEWPTGSGNYSAVLSFDSAFETHLNYVPTDARFLTFQLQMSRGTLVGSDDSLQIYFNGEQVGSPITMAATNTQFEAFRVEIPQKFRTTSVTIKFDLKGNGILDSVARIDDLDFSSQGGTACSTSPGQGAPDSVRQAFITAYNAEGGQANLGCAQGPVQTVTRSFYSPASTVYSQTVSGGSYGSSVIEMVSGASTAYTIRTGFYATYQSSDAATGQAVSQLLVAPTSNEAHTSAPSIVGTDYNWQPFLKGSMYSLVSSPINGGAFNGLTWITYVWGDVAGRYEREGGRTGPMGLPLFNETLLGPSGGWNWWYQWFEKGFVWYAKNPSTGATWSYAFTKTTDVFNSGTWVGLGWCQHLGGGSLSCLAP